MINSDPPLVERLANRDLLRSAAFVGGRWGAAETGATFAVTDPATGEPVARLPKVGAPLRAPRPGAGGAGRLAAEDGRRRHAAGHRERARGAAGLAGDVRRGAV